MGSLIDRARRALQVPDPSTRVRPGVAHEVHRLANRFDVHLYIPQQRGMGVLLWLHGGGRVGGKAEQDHSLCSQIADEAGVLVASVDYRVGPEHPYPAALDDAWTALRWLHGYAADLVIDPTLTAVGGAGGGGGIAAELAHRAHDGLWPVAFQLLVWPMLDDRSTPAHWQPHRDAWTPEQNRAAWATYLGHDLSVDEPRAWAVAARRGDLRGLPPVWIGVGEHDLVVEECMDYAGRLIAAGVKAKIHVEPGLVHRGDESPTGSSAQVAMMRQMMVEALRDRIG